MASVSDTSWVLAGRATASVRPGYAGLVELVARAVCPPQHVRVAQGVTEVGEKGALVHGRGADAVVAVWYPQPVVAVAGVDWVCAELLLVWPLVLPLCRARRQCLPTCCCSSHTPDPTCRPATCPCSRRRCRCHPGGSLRRVPAPRHQRRPGAAAPARPPHHCAAVSGVLVLDPAADEG